MFDTKFVVVLRNDLATWQKLNVTAFVAGGVVARHPEIVGEAYRDGAGNVHHPLSIQPIVVLAAEADLMATIHRRVLEREVESALYVEEMFSTGHDAENRAAFAQFTPDTAKVVGIAFRCDKKIADKITKGAKMHP